MPPDLGPFYREGEILIHLNHRPMEVPSTLRYGYTEPVMKLLATLHRDYKMTDIEVLWPLAIRVIPQLTPMQIAAAPAWMREFLQFMNGEIPSDPWGVGGVSLTGTKLERRARCRLRAFLPEKKISAALTFLNSSSSVQFAERIPRQYGPSIVPSDVKPSPPAREQPIKNWWSDCEPPDCWKRLELKNIAVVDSGCDPQVVPNAKIIPPSGTDVHGHGTFVSGILVGPTTKGCKPLLPASEVWAVSIAAPPATQPPPGKVLTTRVDFEVHPGLYSLVLNALASQDDGASGWPWLRTHIGLAGRPIRVVNLSIRTPLEEKFPGTYAEEEGNFKKIEAANIVVVACSHNLDSTGPSAVTRPALLPTVVSVGAVHDDGSWWTRSRFAFPADYPEDLKKERNYRAVDLCAPGFKIKSWLPNNLTPRDDSGTSFAAPFVTAAIAVLSDSMAAATAAEIRNELFANHVVVDPKIDSKNSVKFGLGILTCVDIRCKEIRRAPDAG